MARLTRYRPALAGRGEQSGLALILVLWILSLLAIIASSFVFSTRTGVSLAANIVGSARAEALADAGIQRAVYALLQPTSDPDRWKGDGKVRTWVYQNETIVITIRDESGKIDINYANSELLKALFHYAGMDDASVEALLDAIQDWRDADSLKRPKGAEADDYAAAGSSYGPSNSNFQTIGELRKVLGMTQDIYRRIADLITVYSGQSGINSAIAGREVLLVLPGTDPVAVDGYIASRDAMLPGQAVPVFAPAAPFSAANSNVFSIVADVKLSDNSRFIREAIVRVGANAKQAAILLARRAPTASIVKAVVGNENMQNGNP